MTSLKSFVFCLRFNKQQIITVPRDEQLEKAIDFLRRVGDISPLLKNWYLQARSLKDALSHNVILEPAVLATKVEGSFDPNFPNLMEFSVWNGEEDPLKGGVTFHYSAHDMSSVSAMRFEDAGALIAVLQNPHDVFLEIIKLAVKTWPEIDWVTISPTSYYRSGKVFKDRQTIGWIGFCPHLLNVEDFPDAHELVTLPGRGNIVVSCPDVMDEKNKAHYELVGDIDTKLVELGYLPMFLS